MSAMRAVRFVTAVSVLLSGLAVGYADARGSAPQTLITERLRQWTDAFNARNVRGVCDLFAPDAIATVPDAPARNRTQICANITRVLAQSDRRVHYASEIHEIIVSDDLAVVRLDWILRVTRGTHVSTTREHGMDVFRKGRNGVWSIVRFIAFSDPEEAR
jgi:uncharacterized protein (TIGR02246 family)